MSPQQSSKASPEEVSAQARWQPTAQQLDSPEKLAMAFKQLLAQHYALQDAHATTQHRLSQAVAKLNEPPPAFPPGSGPTDSMLVGLRIQPVDAANLANGATMTWNKASGVFVIS